MRTLLVGSHFAPPAKALIQCLPAGAKLQLQLEPDNPYDENAIKVSVASSEIPAELDHELDVLVSGMGLSAEEIRNQPEWLLGHIAASGGKPLAKRANEGLVGNLEIGEQIIAGAIFNVKLIFLGDGTPGVEITPA